MPEPENKSRPFLDSARSPEAIEARSFAIIEAEAGPHPPFSGRAWAVARRLVHASGDLTLLSSLYLPETAIEAGIAALRAGCAVYTDTQMTLAGIPARRTKPLGVTARCFLAPGQAAARGTTRARAGMEALGNSLGGAIIAIGNAPTALLALLELLDAGAPFPALVIGMPVGFVNAAESKALLAARADVPCLAVLGRRGGSPLAAATVNALCELALSAE